MAQRTTMEAGDGLETARALPEPGGGGSSTASGDSGAFGTNELAYDRKGRRRQGRHTV